VAADDDVLACRLVRKAVVGAEVEDHAVRVGEREQEVRAGDLLEQRLELGSASRRTSPMLAAAR
jgi:hypothetical protein